MFISKTSSISEKHNKQKLCIETIWWKYTERTVREMIQISHISYKRNCSPKPNVTVLKYINQTWLFSNINKTRLNGGAVPSKQVPDIRCTITYAVKNFTTARQQLQHNADTKEFCHEIKLTKCVLCNTEASTCIYFLQFVFGRRH